MVRFLLSLPVIFALVVMFAAPAGALTLDPENTLYLKLKYGTVVIRLRPDLAPNHVARIKKLARAGFYNGHKFHRVLPNFMAQTGDPTGTGFGGSKEPDLKAEFNHMPFVRGTVGMARGSHSVDSANSQFFIMTNDNRSLDRNYTAWGEVMKGMEFVDMIKKGEPPANPDIMISLKVAADVKK